MTARASSNRKRKKRHREKVGSAPGTLVAAPDAGTTELTVIKFSPEGFEETRVDRFKPEDHSSSDEVRWFNLEGLKNVELLERLGEHFHISRLSLEDVIYSDRACADELEEQVFVKIPMFDHKTHQVEMLSLYLGCSYILTCQEGDPGDSLDPVRERLRSGKGQIRKRGADYLAYALVDAVVDAYFPVLDTWNHRLEQLEDALEQPNYRDETIDEIRTIRRGALNLRRTARYMREGLAFIARCQSSLISDSNRQFFKDSLEHATEVHDELETLREWTTELLNYHQSNLATRTNEAMQTLTVIATIFIPLSFIAGLYGMNFERNSPWNMPELGWTYGYPMVLAVMASVAISFLVYFRRKGWL